MFSTMLIAVGFVLCLSVLFLSDFVVNLIRSYKVRTDEYKAIKEFCKDRDYCYFGCGKGKEGAYYGGYNCRSDHK